MRRATPPLGPRRANFVRCQPPGAAYVYLNYGMYWLFNLLVKGGARDGLILIRALEPVKGIAEMKRRRGKQQVVDLCSGPGKLAMALGITGADHGTPMCGRGRPPGIGLRRPRAGLAQEVSTDVRVGIRKAADHPWRFLAQGHPHVSVPLGKVKQPAEAIGPAVKKSRRARPRDTR